MIGVDGVPVETLIQHDVTVMRTTRLSRWLHGPVILHHSVCPCGAGTYLVLGRREARRRLGRA